MLKVVVFVSSCLAFATMHHRFGELIADERPAPESVEGYSSPQAAFDAFRQARDIRDWRAVYLTLAESSRDSDVFATFDNCIFSLDPKVTAVLTKYGLGLDRVMTEYAKRYRDAFGVDLDSIRAERRRRLDEWRKTNSESSKSHPSTPGEVALKSPGVPPDDLGPVVPPIDKDVLIPIVLHFVTDKVAFYEEANKLLYPQGNRLFPRIGALSDITISGDGARGRAKVTSYFVVSGLVRQDGPSLESVHFLRVNDRWFLHGLPCR